MTCNPKKLRILVAEAPEGINTLGGILGDAAVLIAAGDLAEAAAQLKAQPDLIVCGVHFDGYRMIDLLLAAKAEPATRNVPFLCYRGLDTELDSIHQRSLEISCGALGAVEFIDLVELKHKHGSAADRQFRMIVLSHCQ